IHRTSPVTWLPLLGKFPKARGLCHVDGFPVLRLLRPFRHVPFNGVPVEGIGVSLGFPLPTSHSPSHPWGSFPCSQCSTQARWFRWRVSNCPFRSLRLSPRWMGGAGSFRTPFFFSPSDRYCSVS